MQLAARTHWLWSLHPHLSPNESVVCAGASAGPRWCRFLATIAAANEGLASELRAQRQMRVEQSRLQVCACMPSTGLGGPAQLASVAVYVWTHNSEG